MLRLAFDFIITWRETRTRPNAYSIRTDTVVGNEHGVLLSGLHTGGCQQKEKNCSQG